MEQAAEAVAGQDGFDARFEWGPAGAAALAPGCDVVVVVDVLSFTTAVDVAVGRGAIVYPFRWHDRTLPDFAAQLGAEVAVPRRAMSAEHPYSLSPPSLAALEAGQRLVLSSPNGAMAVLSAAERGAVVVAGCLRNASAVASRARAAGAITGVVAAGERWRDGGMRPAFEDLVGAGAVLDACRPSSPSPEARAAIAAWRTVRDEVTEALLDCTSGRELAAIGFADDVRMAAEVDTSGVAPVLEDRAFRP